LNVAKRFAIRWTACQSATNAGTGERLDMLCGHFVIAPPHDRLLHSYLPLRLVVHAGNDNFEIVRFGTVVQLADLVSLMRRRSSRRARDAERAVGREVRAGVAAGE
jgi:hypothetical protein